MTISMQQAFLGLMKAADRFDPDKGVRFSTLCPLVDPGRDPGLSQSGTGPWSRSAHPRRRRWVYVHARRLENQFGQEEGRSPGGEELEARLATAMGLPRERIAVLRETDGRARRASGLSSL